MPKYSIFPVGDQAVTLSLGDDLQIENHHKVMAMLHWLQQHPFPGLLDIVVAYNSVTVVYDLYLVRTKGAKDSGSGFVHDLLQEAFQRADIQCDTPSPLKRIPVCYEDPFSPDMDFILSEKNLTSAEVIALHTGRNYRVYMIGFLPGFPYMAEVDPLLILPRKPKPRARVEAGSVGIASLQTGIYPVASPGGWQIIGRTPMRLFNREANPPVIFEPGDEVQFYPITKGEFWKLNEHDS